MIVTITSNFKNVPPVELAAWTSSSLTVEETNKAIEEDAEKFFKVMWTMLPDGISDKAILKYLTKHPNKKEFFKKAMLALHQ